MEKRRIRLEINGVVLGLVTEESDEYVDALAGEVGELMRDIQEASPYITREAAALTAALSYCDDLKRAARQSRDLQDRVDELEVEAEIWQEEKEKLLSEQTADPAADPALQERVAALEKENTALAETAAQVEELRRRAAALEGENAALRETAAKGPTLPAGEPARPDPKPVKKHRGNPMRYEDQLDQQMGLVSFFEQNHDAGE